MFKSFSIRNFRCFSELTLTPLERVNLITGMNNVGKTALLEALFLHFGPSNPILPLKVNVFRGIEHLSINAEEMWGWLFFGKDTAQTIELSSTDTTDRQHFLRIRLGDTAVYADVPAGRPSADPSQLSSSLGTAQRPRELILEYKDSEGHTSASQAVITPEGIKAKGPRVSPFPDGFFLSTKRRPPTEDAERFSKLEAVGRHTTVVEIIKLLEPRLRRLAVLVTGGVPMINGDIGLNHLVPVPLMGEGTGHLLSIVLAIANAPQGIVLIDEIENGLHHSVLVKVWKAIALAARQSETQVFATTHSWEASRAAHLAFEEDGLYEFRLHRLERIDSRIKPITYDREALDAAVKAELEVR